MNSVLKSTGRILCSIDWFSAIFEDCSVKEICDFLKLDFNTIFDEIYQEAFTRSIGFEEKIVYRYEGICFECPYSSMYGNFDYDDVSILEVSFPKIRLDISGSGLRFLRSEFKKIDLDLEDYLRIKQSDYHYHVTRSDFAFDLIDYKSEFLDQCIEFVNSQKSDRLNVMNKQGSIVYSMRTGDQKTLYLGAPSSCKLLRIYDKKLQYCKHGVEWSKPYDLEDIPVEEYPNSWIRIELQTRRHVSESILYGDGSYLSILKYIYQNYCFRDLNKEPSYIRQPADFWINLFDWTEIESIIQNSNSVQYKSYTEKVNDTVYGRYFNLIISALARDGLQGFIIKVNQYLYYLQVPKVDPEEERLRQRRYLGLISKLNCLSSELNIDKIVNLKGIKYDRLKKLQIKE